MKIKDLLETEIYDLDEMFIKDKNGKIVAKYNSEDSGCAILNDVEVESITVGRDGTLEIHTMFEDPLDPLDYIENECKMYKEDIACDEYHYDNVHSASEEVLRNLTELEDDIRKIRWALGNGHEWDACL